LSRSSPVIQFVFESECIVGADSLVAFITWLSISVSLFFPGQQVCSIPKLAFLISIVIEISFKEDFAAA
jgi:hypothetical protein